MKIKYVKANPTENKTILVQTAVPRASQASAAGAMLAEDTDAEQVGFFELPSDDRASARLQMMGGEFCGNASISAAAKIAEEQGIKAGEQKNIILEVSGAEGLVECAVEYDGNVYTGTVDMPLPNKVDRMTFEYKDKSYEFCVVFLPGITHIIFEKSKMEADYEIFAEKALKAWGDRFEEEAVGLILFDEETCIITPLVYVKNTESLYWERGCGTGTAAAGVYMSCKYGKSCRLPVKQPGGTIIAETLYEGKEIKKLKITGKVTFETEGIFEYEQ